MPDDDDEDHEDSEHEPAPSKVNRSKFPLVQKEEDDDALDVEFDDRKGRNAESA